MSFFHANTRLEKDTPASVPSSSNPVGCGGISVFGSAASYIGLVPKGNVGNAPEEGCAVDVQNKLMWGDEGTNRAVGPKQIFPRPWATTPNLGLGNINTVDDNSRVLFGHSTANRKSIQTVSDTQFPMFQPLIREKAADIPAHNYFVEPFLRGGLSSRLIPKQRVDLTE